jgi:hypothetical protein
MQGTFQTFFYFVQLRDTNPLPYLLYEWLSKWVLMPYSSKRKIKCGSYHILQSGKGLPGNCYANDADKYRARKKLQMQEMKDFIPSGLNV